MSPGLPGLLQLSHEELMEAVPSSQPCHGRLPKADATCTRPVSMQLQHCMWADRHIPGGRIEVIMVSSNVQDALIWQ